MTCIEQSFMNRVPNTLREIAEEIHAIATRNFLVEYVDENGDTHIEPFSAMTMTAGGEFVINGRKVSQDQFEDVAGAIGRFVISRFKKEG